MKRSATTICLLALLALAPAAKAAYDPLGSGSLTLRIDKGFTASMAEHGIKLLAKAPAKRRGDAYLLPVSGGEADPTTNKGTVETEGQLLFEAKGRKVPLRQIELQAKKAPLFAKVGGGQLKLASAKQLSGKREGFGIGFSAQGLELTQKLATRLDKKLRLGRALKEGQPLGSAKAKTQPQLVTILPQGKASLVPDPAFLAQLKALFVSLNPIAPAELSNPGSILSLPIGVGGQLAPDASAGTLRLSGAIELLQLGAGQIFHKEYWLDLGARQTSAEVEIEPTPAFPGKLGRVGAFDLDMARAAVFSEAGERRIFVSNAPLTLAAQTAQSFNEAFAEGRPVFAAGEAFGAVSFGALGE